jgi:hypothetical protein
LPPGPFAHVRQPGHGASSHRLRSWLLRSVTDSSATTV